MESTDSYPVFHTRLAAAMRRRRGNHHPRLHLTGEHPETWVITLAFTAIDESRARTIAKYAAGRLSTFLPDYDKNYVAISRESDPGVMIPLYCCDDIYCVLVPEHAGPCRDAHGINLDSNAPTEDGAS